MNRMDPVGKLQDTIDKQCITSSLLRQILRAVITLVSFAPWQYNTLEIWRIAL